jgi:hypothetical protein
MTKFLRRGRSFTSATGSKGAVVLNRRKFSAIHLRSIAFNIILIYSIEIVEAERLSTELYCRRFYFG